MATQIRTVITTSINGQIPITNTTIGNITGRVNDVLLIVLSSVIVNPVLGDIIQIFNTPDFTLNVSYPSALIVTGGPYVSAWSNPFIDQYYHILNESDGFNSETDSTFNLSLSIPVNVAQPIEIQIIVYRGITPDSVGLSKFKQLITEVD